MKGGLSKEVVSGEGEFSMHGTYVHLFPVRLVLQKRPVVFHEGGLSKEVLLYYPKLGNFHDHANIKLINIDFTHNYIFLHMFQSIGIDNVW